MTIFTPFLECPSTSKCSKIISSTGGNGYSNARARTWSSKVEQGVLSFNKMREEIIKVIAQFPEGSPIEHKCVLSKWCNDYGVLEREKYKII
jgi:hypothetical protein